MSSVWCFWKFKISQLMELRRLDRTIKQMATPSASQLIITTNGLVVWEIPIKDGSCFMQFSGGGSYDQRYIVHVDTEKFYRHWLVCSGWKGQLESYDCVLRVDMPNDYKYMRPSGAHACMTASSKKSPVPLATANAYNFQGRNLITFTDGITRTFWLIVNRAPSFPIAARSKADAEVIYKLAGIGIPPIHFNDLLERNPNA